MQGSGVVALWGCRVVSAGGVCSPSRVVGEFPSDYIFDAVGEVVEAVEAFEELAAGHRAGRGYRVRGVSRFRQEDTVHPEASKVGGGGRLLACEEVRVDHTGREVVGRPKVRG
jgi:hypothetical protein